MPDRHPACRVRHVLIVLALFVSQLTVFSATVKAMCLPSDCEEQATTQVTIPSDSPVDPVDQGRGCNTASSLCSLVSAGVPVIADAIPATKGTLVTVIGDDRFPPDIYVPPPHRPPRT